MLCRSFSMMIVGAGMIGIFLGNGTHVAAAPPAQKESDGSTPRQAGLVAQEFIFDEVPFDQCHASTIAETPAGLVAAWFAGSREGNQDVGIWVSRHRNGRWSAPVEVAQGLEGDREYPCWNPVLFQPSEGPLLLFYKVGPSPSRWWGVLRTSGDHGETWSDARRLPDGILGPVKNKPVLLEDDRLLCGSSTEHDGWRVHMETTTDWGKTWDATESLNDGETFAAIQPTILIHGDKLQILCRTRQDVIAEAWSEDGGRTWSKLQKSNLPNPNSGIDGVTLKDGRSLLVYNHTRRGRSPLNVSVTRDGRHWKAAIVLENQPGEYSYPAVIQTSDGLVHTTYTYRRRKIKHVVLDPEKFELQDITEGRWPE